MNRHRPLIRYPVRPRMPPNGGGWRAWRMAALSGPLLVMLAGCSLIPGADTEPIMPDTTRPMPAPERPDDQAAPSPPAPPSDASRNMLAYLASVEDRLIARGRLRTDPGHDIPVTSETLSQIFAAVALRDEYARKDGQLVRSGRAAPLRRWAEPVRLQIEFGASVPPEQRRRDRAAIAGLAARLTDATSHPVSLVGAGGNFIVLILDEDERRAIGPRLEALLPGIPTSDVRVLADLSPQIFCTAFAYSRGSSPVYSHAVALIRAELGPRLRSSCFHEELAQGLGLANDSPLARPSVFNDDEEFAHLTWLDEVLLGMLYDPRLTPGMYEAGAMPLIRQLASEHLPAAGT